MIARLLMSGALLLCVLLACNNERQELMSDLSDRLPAKRAAALTGLGRMGDDQAYTLVARGLDDPSAIVRVAAVKALDAFPGRDTSAPISRAAIDPDPEVREAVVDSLARRKTPDANRLLIAMLARDEPIPRLRKRIKQALASRGTTGERLGKQLVDARLAELRKKLEEADGGNHAEWVRLAGRLAGDGGLEIVLDGLSAKSTDVVLTALKVLDGRGGDVALQRLQLLLADPSWHVRLAVVGALARFSDPPVALMEQALRDARADVRLAALQQRIRLKPDMEPSRLCRMLSDPAESVAVVVAQAMHDRQLDCPLDSLIEKAQSEKSCRSIIALLQTLASPNAKAGLSALLARPGSCPDWRVAAALAHLGPVSTRVRTRLLKSVEAWFSHVQQVQDKWVKDRLGPRQTAAQRAVDLPGPLKEPPRAADGTDEEEARAITRRLDTMREAFSDRKQPTMGGDLFDPLDAADLERLAEMLVACLEVDQRRGLDLIGQALEFGQPHLTGELARRLLRDPEAAARLEPASIQRMIAIVPMATPADCAHVADLTARLGDASLAPALAGVLDKLDWAQRPAVITALGTIGSAAAIDALIALLKTYSAADAAKALARIGDKRAVDPLLECLKHAGPAEAHEIFAALARLGSQDVVPELLSLLEHPDADVRRSAIRVLAEIDRKDVRDALEGLRYDPDRLVRRELAQIDQPTRKPEEGSHGRQ